MFGERFKLSMPDFDNEEVLKRTCSHIVVLLGLGLLGPGIKDAIYTPGSSDAWLQVAEGPLVLYMAHKIRRHTLNEAAQSDAPAAPPAEAVQAVEAVQVSTEVDSNPEIQLSLVEDATPQVPIAEISTITPIDTHRRSA